MIENYIKLAILENIEGSTLGPVDSLEDLTFYLTYDDLKQIIITAHELQNKIVNGID